MCLVVGVRRAASFHVVVHIRREDFKQHHRVINLGYYLDVLTQISYRNLYISGDEFDEDVKNRFRPLNPTYVHVNPVKDFLFIKGFNRIVQSQSTFAWWAGFLSDAEEIYAPVPVLESDPTRALRSDLHVDDEARYHYTFNVPVE